MTVRELIRILEAHDPDLDVLIASSWKDYAFTDRMEATDVSVTEHELTGGHFATLKPLREPALFLGPAEWVIPQDR